MSKVALIICVVVAFNAAFVLLLTSAFVIRKRVSAMHKRNRLRRLGIHSDRETIV